MTMLEITDIAAEKLAAHMEQQKSDKAVRITTRGGG